MIDAPQKAEQVRTFKSFDVNVPVGFELPLGQTVEEGFALHCQAGVRWFPDWDEPRFQVCAYRELHGGSAMGFMGERAAMFALPAWAREIAPLHGVSWFDPKASDARKAAKEQGLEAPAGPEPVEAFVLPMQTRH